MLPVLLDLKFIKIYTMGVFLVLAFFWGSFVLWRLIRLSSYKEEDIFDSLFNALWGGLLMGRVVYVALNFREFGFDLFKFLLINGYPGISLYGALFGFFLVLHLQCMLKKIRTDAMADYFIPSLFLAEGIGKLGSFFSGSEAGVRTAFILSVKYANMDGLRHLSPFYESIAFFILAYLAHKVLFEIRKDHLQTGFNASFFFWGHAFVYFLFDNMKQYRLYFLGYSFNGAVSAILLLTFSFYFVYYFRSPIKDKTVHIKNLILRHVKKSFKNIFRKAKKEDRRRTKKNPPSG
jgi:prolipoprotein diacylglyceryltransferase